MFDSVIKCYRIPTSALVSWNLKCFSSFFFIHLTVTVTPQRAILLTSKKNPSIVTFDLGPLSLLLWEIGLFAVLWFLCGRTQSSDIPASVCGGFNTALKYIFSGHTHSFVFPCLWERPYSSTVWKIFSLPKSEIQIGFTHINVRASTHSFISLFSPESNQSSKHLYSSPNLNKVLTLKQSCEIKTNSVPTMCSNWKY